ncbi:MAG: hypothetical protein V2I63_01275, partial [Pseudomonadales bacterium]|nr:hypothetical protein [Pseudomonadales bacterium]
MKRYRLLLPACLLLNACGSNPVEKGATLASLDDLEALPVVEQSEATELPTIEEARERAIASYRAYLRDA